MIRNLYILVLMFGCTGLSVQAKGVVPTTDVPSTKTKKTEAKATASVTTTKDKAKTTTALTPTPNRDEANPTFAKTSDKTTPSEHAKAAPMMAKTADKPVASSHPTQQARSSATAVASIRNPSLSHASSHSSFSSERLARLTAYWAGEGDYYTGKCMSSTGIRLHDGHCAVDPRIIPYGSTVNIAGFGSYLAVDTGSAVISREAAKEAGHTPEERSALVIDLFFESRRDGERFEASATKYAVISWTSPRSTASTQEAGSLSAE